MKKWVLLIAATLFLSFIVLEAANACGIEDREDLVVIRRLEKRSGCSPISISFPKVIKLDESFSGVDPNLKLYFYLDGEEIFSSVLNETRAENDWQVTELCISSKLLSESKLVVTYDEKAKPKIQKDGSVLYPVRFCGPDPKILIIIDKLDEKIIDSK